MTRHRSGPTTWMPAPTRNQSEPRSDRRRTRRVTAVLVAVLLLGGATVLGLTHPTVLRDVAAMLAGVDWILFGLATLTQVFSVGALARQQRRLMSTSGPTLALPSVVATTYVGGTISLSIPIVGKAAAAAYSYRRFTQQGVPPVTVTWALAMSAIHLVLAYLTIGAIAALATGSLDAIITALLAIATVILPLTIFISALRAPAIKRGVEAAIDRAITWARRATRRPWRRAQHRIHSAIDVIACTRIGGRDTVAVAAWSLLNMSATFAAFTLSILAVGGVVPWPTVITTWIAGYGASQLGLTPGGIGIVEATLTLGLTTAGVSTATAIAAALLYRIISFWITAITGSITFLLTSPSTASRKAQPVPGCGHADERKQSRDWPTDM